MVAIQNNTINILSYVLIFALLIYSLTGAVAAGSIDFYSKDESPFGISNGDWVAKYWNWDYSLPIDPQTSNIAGLKENGCLIHKENSTVMLADTAFGGSWNQNCTISHNEGILIPIWTGECNQGVKECANDSFEDLSKAARGYDLGKVKGLVKVDNIPVAMLDATDLKANIMNNITEVNTKQYNAIVPDNTHNSNERFGTFPAAAHGWFAFLKPLQPGNHTVYYQNSVEPTTLSGAGNSNTAQYTYHFNVK